MRVNTLTAGSAQMKSFVEFFLVKLSQKQNTDDSRLDETVDSSDKKSWKQLNRMGSLENHDWSIIPMIFNQITLHEWRTAQIGLVSFKKSAIDSTLTLESSLLDLLKKMSDQSRILCFLAIANSDATQISNCISLKDLLRFMVNNYKGDLKVFRQPQNNITSFAKQTLVRANERDSLLHVLRVMAASRISVLPIERTLEGTQTTFTVGLLFLNDLLYLFGTQNFWECLNDPVVDFFKELYGAHDYLDAVSDYRSEKSTN